MESLHFPPLLTVINTFCASSVGMSFVRWLSTTQKFQSSRAKWWQFFVAGS